MATRHFCDVCDKQLTKAEFEGDYSAKLFSLDKPSANTINHPDLCVSLTIWKKQREKAVICIDCTIEYLQIFKSTNMEQPNESNNSPR